MGFIPNRIQMSKGSKQRRRDVNEETYTANWDRVFGILHHDSLRRGGDGIPLELEPVWDESDPTCGNRPSER